MIYYNIFSIIQKYIIPNDTLYHYNNIYYTISKIYPKEYLDSGIRFFQIENNKKNISFHIDIDVAKIVDTIPKLNILYKINNLDDIDNLNPQTKEISLKPNNIQIDNSNQNIYLDIYEKSKFKDKKDIKDIKKIIEYPYIKQFKDINDPRLLFIDKELFNIYSKNLTDDGVKNYKKNIKNLDKLRINFLNKPNFNVYGDFWKVTLNKNLQNILDKYEYFKKKYKEKEKENEKEQKKEEQKSIINNHNNIIDYTQINREINEIYEKINTNIMKNETVKNIPSDTDIINKYNNIIKKIEAKEPAPETASETASETAPAPAPAPAPASASAPASAPASGTIDEEAKDYINIGIAYYIENITNDDDDKDKFDNVIKIIEKYIDNINDFGDENLYINNIINYIATIKYIEKNTNNIIDNDLLISLFDKIKKKHNKIDLKSENNIKNVVCIYNVNKSNLFDINRVINIGSRITLDNKEKKKSDSCIEYKNYDSLKDLIINIKNLKNLKNILESIKNSYDQYTSQINPDDKDDKDEEFKKIIENKSQSIIETIQENDKNDKNDKNEEIIRLKKKPEGQIKPTYYIGTQEYNVYEFNENELKNKNDLLKNDFISNDKLNICIYNFINEFILKKNLLLFIDNKEYNIYNVEYKYIKPDKTFTNSYYNVSDIPENEIYKKVDQKKDNRINYRNYNVNVLINVTENDMLDKTPKQKLIKDFKRIFKIHDLRQNCNNNLRLLDNNLSFLYNGFNIPKQYLLKKYNNILKRSGKQYNDTKKLKTDKINDDKIQDDKIQDDKIQDDKIQDDKIQGKDNIGGAVNKLRKKYNNKIKKLIKKKSKIYKRKPINNTKKYKINTKNKLKTNTLKR